MQNELINIGHTILKEYNIEGIKISFKEIRKGWSSLKGNISIPLWAINKGLYSQDIQGKYFALYYVIHEVVHQIIYKQYKTFKHTKEFKDLEISLLARYNIIPKYSRAYPKALYNREGSLLYQRT